MADHPIDILLRAKDQASKTIRGVNAELSRTAKISGMAGKGLQSAGKNLAGIGAIGLVGLGAAVKTGLDDLAALENATTSVDGAIRQMGLTGQVTSGQIAGWANDIEKDIGAAFDDKAIVAGTSSLIRYGKVAPENLRPAMEVMTDLAAKTGSVESAADKLSKSLADPTKATRLLREAGVRLTKEQQKQITAMVEVNDIAGAQALLLREVAKTTEGAALASQGKYQRSLSVLSDVAEDARKALAEGFLPVIEKVADMLSDGLSNPKTMDDIREFGKGMAAGLDDLIDIAKALPWGTIGDSLKLAGSGAKTVLSAFTGLPPWVQTAVLTGWGLDKLTGGALSGIVGELGKGLIKGVLGMTAGVVNLKAGVVNGGGGMVPGAGGGGGKGVVGKVTTAASVATKIVVPLAVGIAIGESIKAASGQSETEWKNTYEAGLKRLGGGLGTGLEQTKTAVKNADDNARGEQVKHRARLDAVKAKQQESLIAFRAGERATTTGTTKVANQTTAGASRVTSQSIANASRITSAIGRIPAPQTTVKVYVTAAKVTTSQTTQNRYGSGTGSYGDDRKGGP